MVSIVVLCHNKAAYTRACLMSVLETRPPEMELVVVDNASTDETPKVLDEVGEKGASLGVAVKVLRQEQNRGCSTSRNAAVAASSGSEVVFLDNDTVIPDPAWLTKLREALYSGPKVAIVGPRICYPFAPHWIQCAGVGVTKTGRVQFRGRGESKDDPRFATVEPVQTLISACFMFRRALYDEIGGLDEAFNPIQYEDFDFCYRARSRGYTVLYTPEPIIYHWESITSDGTPALQNRYIIVKHGMLFKERWRHMFERENGPSDEETQWRTIEMPSLHGPRRR